MVHSVPNGRVFDTANLPIRHFPPEAEQIERLVQRLRHFAPYKDDCELSIVRAPLRISPLGAHIDHQLGVVTGFTINQSILMAFVPTEDGSIHIESVNFDRPSTFATHAVPDFSQGDWANYARGAVLALREEHRLDRGLVGVIGGTMPIGGLSSSAAVTLAYLLAFEAVNRLAVDEADNVQHCRYTENKYVGLNNGILDQSVILFSAPDHLTCIDCQSVEVRRILYADRAPADDGLASVVTKSSPRQTSLPYEVLVVYSGVTRGLTGTDYNSRVAECQAAAELLLRSAGESVPIDVRLRHVRPEIHHDYRHFLSPPLQRRAAHFFGEMQRVQDGIEAWQAGDVHRFGALMNQSGASSIEKYECGSPHLITLYEILSSTPGVYGTRFSGAGFRGNCIALIDPAHREKIASAIHERFPTSHPDVAEKYSIHFCHTAGPATLIGPYTTKDSNEFQTDRRA